MRILVQSPIPNRIVLECSPFVGPFLPDFDPRIYLEVYIDGRKHNITSFSFDHINNRYLLFLENFNLDGVIQVIHHTPILPFSTGIPYVYNVFYDSNPNIGAT